MPRPASLAAQGVSFLHGLRRSARAAAAAPGPAAVPPPAQGEERGGEGDDGRGRGGLEGRGHDAGGVYTAEPIAASAHTGESACPGGAGASFARMSAPLPALLKQVFGYDGFRPLQREIMDASLAGRDVLAVLPTGAGKSLCYQLPALARGGLTVVVSPLIALMKDQVDQLRAAGVAATFINSTLEAAEFRERMAGLSAGEYRLLYAAPERLMLPDFLPWLRQWSVSALAVDEAHCISEWGHDFRPEYRQLSQVREMLPAVPVIALTATATPRVREDIATQLRLRQPEVFVASFNRPNLTYRVVPKSKPEAQVAAFARERAEESGIVYCQSRKSAEAYAATLRAAGLPAVAYHAGLEGAERSRNQDAFLRDEARIVCATVAFGMGINKPNVRWVLHADLPKNVEGYYQETGRAGRDGLPSECVLLFSRGDAMKIVRFMDEITDEQAKAIARRQLDQMVAYADSPHCRRVPLLGYFGEEWTEENCGACDACLEPRETWDATQDAQKLLSCLFRIRQQSRFDTGLAHVADVLAGGNTEKIRRWGHERLSTYGVGADRPRAAWVALGRQLIALGHAAVSADGFQTVSLTAQGLAALKSREPIFLTRLPTDRPAAEKKAPLRRAGDIPCDDGLFQALRTLRKRLADERDVPPYVIFSDVTLRHLAREYPQTTAELLRIPGVGEKKAADFGAVFLAEIAAWTAKHPRQMFEPLPSAPSASRPEPPEPRLRGGPTATLELFREGVPIDEIATRRSLKRGTICKHLADAVAAGELELSPSDFYTAEEEQRILASAARHGWTSLGVLHEELGDITYEKLHFARAFAQRSGQ